MSGSGAYHSQTISMPFCLLDVGRATQSWGTPDPRLTPCINQESRTPSCADFPPSPQSQIALLYVLCLHLQPLQCRFLPVIEQVAHERRVNRRVKRMNGFGRYVMQLGEGKVSPAWVLMETEKRLKRQDREKEQNFRENEK